MRKMKKFNKRSNDFFKGKKVLHKFFDIYHDIKGPFAEGGGLFQYFVRKSCFKMVSELCSIPCKVKVKLRQDRFKTSFKIAVRTGL